MINFITAADSQVVLMSNDTVVVRSADAEVLAAAITGYGMSEDTFCSSSMDFADEEGFDTAGAAYAILDDAQYLALNA